MCSHGVHYSNWAPKRKKTPSRCFCNTLIVAYVNSIKINLTSQYSCSLLLLSAFHSWGTLSSKGKKAEIFFLFQVSNKRFQ